MKSCASLAERNLGSHCGLLPPVRLGRVFLCALECSIFSEKLVQERIGL